MLDQSQLDPKQATLLKRPVEARVEQYRLLKAQLDFQHNDARATADSKAAVKAKFSREESKNKQVGELLKKYHAAYHDAKYAEAVHYAQLAHELDPDNYLATAAVELAKMQINVTAAKDLKERKAQMFLQAANEAEDPGQAADAIRNRGVALDKEALDKASKRKGYQRIGMRRSEKELQLESKLNMPVCMSHTHTPLYQVIEDLLVLRPQHLPGRARPAKGRHQQGPAGDGELRPISLKSALNLLLHGLNLTWIIKDEVIQITTEQEARGKNLTITYEVADLVMPIQNFGNLQANPGPSSTVLNPATPHPYVPTPIGGRGSLPNGEAIGSPTGAPNANSPFTGGGDHKDGPGGWSTKSANASETTQDALMHLITSSVAPSSWSEMGGAGTIEYFPMTMALVINQTPDIQEQIADLWTRCGACRTRKSPWRSASSVSPTTSSSASASTST